jgi:hypothetical protein
MGNLKFRLASGTSARSLARLDADDDRVAVWRDVLATMNGAKIKAKRQPSRPTPP